MSLPVMFTELRSWPAKRRMIAAGVAFAALTVLVVASGTVMVTSGSLTFPGPWWAYAVTVVGAGLAGLVVASYFDAPIGADATMCDVRWPVLGLIAVYLSTDLRTAVPVLDGTVRPVVAAAAVGLLVWALLERLGSERRATSEAGEVCTTCRPLFPRSQSQS